MKIKYVGGSPSRDVAGIECVRGVPVEIPDAIALRLVERPQGDYVLADDSAEAEE